MQLRGHAVCFGDNVPTGMIISSRHASKQGDPKSLVPYLFEGIRAGIHTKLPGAILVAGLNFGAGSTREIAPVLLREAGIAGVAARSFSRGFYRNCVNLGIPVVEVDTVGTSDDDDLMVDLESGRVQNLTRGLERQAKPLPEIMQRILLEGGLIPFFRRYRSFILDGE